MVAPCAERCTDRTRLTGQLARLRASGHEAAPTVMARSQSGLQMSRTSRGRESLVRCAGELDYANRPALSWGSGLLRPVRTAALPRLALGGAQTAQFLEGVFVDLLGLYLCGVLADLLGCCLPVAQGLVFRGWGGRSLCFHHPTVSADGPITRIVAGAGLASDTPPEGLDPILDWAAASEAAGMLFSRS